MERPVVLNRAFLTIYIPTYRRPDALRLQVSELTKQLRYLDGPSRDSVRVHVRLNGARDHDPCLLGELEQLVEGLGNFCFVVNSVNVGGNANIAMGFTVASSEGYLWTLSDNDLIRPSLLADILKALRGLSPDILINCGGQTSGLQTLSYRMIGDLHEHPLYALGLISRGIYKMSYLSVSGEVPFLYHNSSFPHLAIAFHAFRCNETCNLYVMQGSAFIENDESVSDHKGDYSLSYAGRAQLIEFVPECRRRSFAIGFLRSGALDLVRSSRRYPAVVASSLVILLLNAPLSVIFLLPLCFVVNISERLVLRAAKSASRAA